MAHRHIIGFVIAFVGIIFIVIGATSFESRIVIVDADSIMVRIFDQNFNAPMVFLGIVLLVIGVWMRFRDKKNCKICNHKR